MRMNPRRQFARNRITRQKLAFAALLALTLFLAGCADGLEGALGQRKNEISFVHGTVATEDGMPISDIQIVGGGRSVTSDRAGRWTISGLTDEITVTPRHDKWRFEPSSRTGRPGASGLRFTGYRLGASYYMNVTIEGPEHAYPVEGALVQINGEFGYTNPLGNAIIHHLDPDSELHFTVTTEFSEHTWIEGPPGGHPATDGLGDGPGGGLGGGLGDARDYESALSDAEGFGRPRHFTIPLPAGVLPEDVADSIFDNRRTNTRWRRGAEITLFVHHYGTKYVTETERQRLDDLVEESLKAWLLPADPANPYLVWGGRAATADEATVVFHLVHGWPVDEQLPEGGEHLADSTALLYPHDQQDGMFRYRIGAEVLLRTDRTGYRAISLHSINGWIFGLNWPSPDSGPSAIRDPDVSEPTELDITLLRMKMHIPPVPYEPWP